MHTMFSEIQSFQPCDGVKGSLKKSSANVHSIIGLFQRIKST